MAYVKTVDEYIASKSEWAEPLQLLKKIFLSTPLKEEVKWGMPTYTHQRKNIAAFSAYKTYVAIWFFQGVFLKDRAGVLVNAREGVTRAMRQWRFSHAGDIRENRLLIQEYLEEAIRNQEAGLEIKADRKRQSGKKPGNRGSKRSGP